MTPMSRYRIYGGLRNYKNTILDYFFQKPDDSVEQLEKRVARQFDVQEAVATPMARVGIYLALKNLIRPGQKVLLSPYTIADVINVVIAAGGRPHFVDVEPHTGNMDPQLLRGRLDPTCGAILVTHLHGISAEIEEIMAVANKNGLPVIEDTAQCLGAHTGSRYVGSFGDAGVLSFGTYKNINSWYGGMVLCKDRSLAKKIREELAQWPEFDRSRLMQKVRQAFFIDLFGWPPIFSPILSRVFRHGFLNDVAAINKVTAIELDTSRRDYLLDWYMSRFTSIQAKRVLEQWPDLDQHSHQRIEKAALYDQWIEGDQELIKPPAPQNRRHVYTYYPLQAKHRTDLLKWLMYYRRDIAPQHLKNCAQLESFREFAAHCPEAERVARSVILLPTYPSYQKSEVMRNISVIRWYKTQNYPEYGPHPRSSRPQTLVFE